jgi:two-component system chemotaxis sensor kinase CheA
LFVTFLKEAQVHLAAIPALLGKLESSAGDAAALQDLLREIHSLKGAASAVEQDDVAFVCRVLEQRIHKAQRGDKAVDGGFFELFRQGVGLLHSGLPETARGGNFIISLQFLDSVRKLT